MVQGISPKILYNQYDIRKPGKGSYIVFIRGNCILCRIDEDRLSMPTYGEADTGDGRYLISVDDDMFFYSTDASASAKLESMGYEYHNIKELRTPGPDWLKFGTLTAFSIAGWYEKNRYCGCCGSSMKHSDTERAMICGNCGITVYPKICPVVIVGVIHEDTILLTKYKDRMRYDKYALIAGFAEIGETLEQTVAREVYEETGIRVKNLRYYKSQPWAFSDSLLCGFFCEADGDNGPRPDGVELGFADWMSRDRVPALQDSVSLTAEMMDLFKRKGREVLK